MTEVCPSCGRSCVVSKNAAPVCESCGTDFQKYEALKVKEREESEQRRANVARRVEESRKLNARNRGLPILPICIAAGLIVLVGFLLFSGDDEAGTKPELDAQIYSAEDSNKPPSNNKLVGLNARINAAYPPRNPIERARNATVFIRTSWGTLGSGFIMSQDCRVITNRHVVESSTGLDEKQLSLVYDNIYKAQRAPLDRQIKQLKDEYQQLLKQVSSRHVRAVRQQEKIDAVQLKINRLSSKVRRQIEQNTQGGSGSSEFKVSLVDGSEYTISSARFSDNFDLATFKLPEDNCPYLIVGSNDDLQQGMQLFTIGSPSGLTYSVTSGVFSGFREDEFGRFLQTDAPINPGNSGGPLILQNGRVVGINTAILEGTEGIGFSLPIEYAISEFK